MYDRRSILVFDNESYSKIPAQCLSRHRISNAFLAPYINISCEYCGPVKRSEAFQGKNPDLVSLTPHLHRCRRQKPGSILALCTCSSCYYRDYHSPTVILKIIHKFWSHMHDRSYFLLNTTPSYLERILYVFSSSNAYQLRNRP